MYRLSNAHLTAELLDPVADAARLGTRFCWGGYIWQIYDTAGRSLLAGPEWPNAEPSSFNGQGLPESFRHRRRDGQPLTWTGQHGVAIGIGELEATTDGGCRITQPCTWKITPEPDRISFETAQDAVGVRCQLTRVVELAGPTVRSHSRLTNCADRPLVLQWFVHPFFPLTDGLIAVDVPPGAALGENAGFAVAKGRLTQCRRFLNPHDGAFETLHVAPHAPLEVRVSHPVFRHVRFATDFAPSEVVIWGNSNTFSLEPYLDLDLAPGATRAWTLEYEFA